MDGDRWRKLSFPTSHPYFYGPIIIFYGTIIISYDPIAISAIKLSQNLFKNQLIVSKPVRYAILQMIRYLVRSMFKHTNLHYALHYMLAYPFDSFVWIRWYNKA